MITRKSYLIFWLQPSGDVSSAGHTACSAGHTADTLSLSSHSSMSVDDVMLSPPPFNRVGSKVEKCEAAEDQDGDRTSPRQKCCHHHRGGQRRSRPRTVPELLYRLNLLVRSGGRDVDFYGNILTDLL